MLRLHEIKKDYVTSSETVAALKGVSVSFRKNEFVSILGPSGCGKTTLLNIIGGLDHYTSGDLVIGGRSTSSYTDRDWDVYRNHRIGFIFQSYNLIPHQTVLGNVELALTIAGIGREERIERAKRALDRVGLSDQYYKKPNQLSGGQCQRVAIASRQQCRLARAAALPDGADGVDHIFTGQAVTPGQLRPAGFAAAQPPAFLQQLRPCGAMNRPVHAATPKQAVVRGVDDGVHLHPGDIVPDNLKRHKNPPVFKSVCARLLPVLYHKSAPFAK
jgi:predicted ABC-type transport system involved in lysophospholipase L1 biosynthesis ATPase subunit